MTIALDYSPVDLEKVRTLVDRAARGDLNAQTDLCRPWNPDAPAFFIFNFCLSHDEERGGAIGRLPDPRGRGEFLLRWIEAIDAPRFDPHNVLDEKTRRKLHTWGACFYNVWALQWLPGYSVLLISKSEDHVDDGGKTEQKVFSMFGRMRFAHDRLPAHVSRPISWSYMSGTCPENSAYVVGRAPSRDAGRGGGFVRVFVDEAEHVEWMEEIHVAIDPGCKLGKVYMSTVNGEATVSARLAKQIRAGRLPTWRLFECDWWDDPACAEGIRDTEAGPERERYGLRTSPWFQSATSAMLDEDVASEYLRDRRKSAKATCFYEWRKDVHVVTRPRVLAYDPRFDVHVGLDFGKARKTAAVIGQPRKDRHLSVIGDFEGVRKTAPEIARELVFRLAAVAPGHPLKEVILVPDPSGLYGDARTDVPILDDYLQAGFERYELPPVAGPGSVKVGIHVVNVALMRREIEIDGSCVILIEALPLYRWPIDRATGDVRRDGEPFHGMESHVCDAFRYLSVHVFGLGGARTEDTFRMPSQEPIVRILPDGSRSERFDDDDDAMRPIGPLLFGGH